MIQLNCSRISVTRIKLIAIAKNEAANLTEWIYHHFSIGVDFIDIYINGSDDNSLNICKKIKAADHRFNFFDADQFLQGCIKRRYNFQLALIQVLI